MAANMAAKMGFILKKIYSYVEVLCIQVLNIDFVRGCAAVKYFESWRADIIKNHKMAGYMAAEMRFLNDRYLCSWCFVFSYFIDTFVVGWCLSVK